ncbi:hypothetical protein GWI33_002921 [Rhynchophorus ferrugineus]|uniref:Uncharacterized protein n=1 Tax=Rhynchophorus ferrugineus TaxID=354439 RepID=A0A834ML27_RHYFE|nr:hypothetical protein GWI33_002921 [Rhynchophorus ferrugineus]
MSGQRRAPFEIWIFSGPFPSLGPRASYQERLLLRKFHWPDTITYNYRHFAKQNKRTRQRKHEDERKKDEMGKRPAVGEGYARGGRRRDRYGEKIVNKLSIGARDGTRVRLNRRS